MSSQESDIEEKLVDLDINEDKKGLDTFNLLLLGETGVGKSTLINSIANYLTYKYFDVAEENDLHILIPSAFGMKDKNQKDHRIEIGSSSDINEYLEIGASATQDVKTYVFPIWRDKVKVRIIDTPGLGDTRGIEQDEKNCRNVLKYVSKLDYLHGICFLFKPTEARKTMFFEYCFSQLLCHLDKLASSKLFFVFTKTRGVNYGATETINVLETVLTEIKKYSPDVDIPLILDSNIFCFDNEAFRYIAAMKKNIEFANEEKRNYKKSWKESVKSWWNLMKSVRRCNKVLYTPTNIAALTNGRFAIRCFSDALSKISDSIRDNDTLLQKLLTNHNCDVAELEELKAKETFKATVVQKQRQSMSSMVCTERSCIEIYKVGNETQRHYKTICHNECEEILHPVMHTVGHPELVNCYVINNINKQCSHCKCDFSAHMLIDYQTMIREDDVVDEDTSNQIKTKESLLRSSLDVIQELQRKNYELMQEYNTIKEVCHKLASFIRLTAIVPFNYSYGEYVEQCIKTEQSNQSPNKALLENYRKLLRENEELNKIFEDALMTNQAVSLLDSDISLEEIESRYEQLFSLKFIGRHIRELLSRDEVLIDNHYEIPEYVHQSKFDYKTERRRRSKDRQKQKTNKEDKKSSKENVNYDSDASSVMSKKDQEKINKEENWDDDSSDSNKSCPISNSNSKKRDRQRKRSGKKYFNKTHGGKNGGKKNIECSNNVQRSRTPPPPYSHIWTPSGSKQLNVGDGSAYPYSLVHNSPNSPNNQSDNFTKNDNPANDNRYEITVSIKEKHNNQSGYHHQQTPNIQGYPPRPPPPPSFPPQLQYPHGPHHPYNPRYTQPVPRHISHDPRFVPHPPQNQPFYHQAGPRYPPPNQQYGVPGPLYAQGHPPFPFPSPPPYSAHPPRTAGEVNSQKAGTSQQSKNGNYQNKKEKFKSDNARDKNFKITPRSGNDDRKEKFEKKNLMKKEKSKSDNSGDQNGKNTPGSGHNDRKDKFEKNVNKSRSDNSGDRNKNSKSTPKSQQNERNDKSKNK